MSIRIEGVVRLSIEHSLEVLRYLLENDLVDARGNLKNYQTGKVISHDKPPHVRVKSRVITIPNEIYPTEFLNVLLKRPSEGWLAFAEPRTGTVSWVLDGARYDIQCKHLWQIILQENLHVLLRNYNYLESEAAAEELAFSVARLIYAGQRGPLTSKKQSAVKRLQRLLHQEEK